MSHIKPTSIHNAQRKHTQFLVSNQKAYTMLKESIHNASMELKSIHNAPISQYTIISHHKVIYNRRIDILKHKIYMLAVKDTNFFKHTLIPIHGQGRRKHTLKKNKKKQALKA